MVTTWRCATHNVTLVLRPGYRHLRGILGETGSCILSQAKPAAEYRAFAIGTKTRWVWAGRSRLAEQIEEMTDHE